MPPQVKGVCFRSPTFHLCIPESSICTPTQPIVSTNVSSHKVWGSPLCCFFENIACVANYQSNTADPPSLILNPQPQSDWQHASILVMIVASGHVKHCTLNTFQCRQNYSKWTLIKAFMTNDCSPKYIKHCQNRVSSVRPNGVSESSL